MKLRILGTRGVPAEHGGFESFAEQLALYLTEKGHEVTVYCQRPGFASGVKEDTWRGIHRVIICSGEGSKGSILFDLRSVLHAAKQDGMILSLGYNTAVFSLVFRIAGKRNVMNMDGLEWKRDKWSRPQRLWLWANEWLGARFANHLVADHPEIAKHLERHTNPQKITVIPYTATETKSDREILKKLELCPGEFDLIIARPEPENSVLEIVRAYSSKYRKYPLVILGRYRELHVAYHAEVLRAASDQIKFLGPIYDQQEVTALRLGARIYFHGHRVGGTNPSLVEALSTRGAVIAHDNKFNTWVAGPGARYFKDEKDLRALLDELDQNTAQIELMKQASWFRFDEAFRPEQVLGVYEKLLLQEMTKQRPSHGAMRSTESVG